MNDFTPEELQKALTAIASIISKCEKVEPKLKPGSSQHSLLKNRLKALHIASLLIAEALRKQA